jgi:hypothetical protein
MAWNALYCCKEKSGNLLHISVSFLPFLRVSNLEGGCDGVAFRYFFGGWIWVLWKVFSLAESAASDLIFIMVKPYRNYLIYSNIPIFHNTSLYYEDSFLDVENVLLTLNYLPLGAIANIEYFHKPKENRRLPHTMALDAQSNWNIEMSQPFKVPLRPSTKATEIASPAESYPILLPSQSSREILLPSEIIANILCFIPRRTSSQSTFWACTLVSRAWYSASIELLYSRPYLNGGNFAEFVSTVCPSKNAHIRRSTLAVLVRRLDMGELVHNASKSLTARLLGRLKGNVEEFVAPQASFAINSFAALSKCTRLRHLDLSLISASISNKLLFQTLKSLHDLETLFFPRSSSHDHDHSSTSYSWPPRLQALHLAGGIDDFFLSTHLINAPPSLSRLSIQHCSQIHAPTLLSTLQTVGPQLRHLTIRHPMPQLYAGALDSIPSICPSLTAFRISADYISNTLFTLVPPSHPLQILDLDCSPTAEADVEISASAIYDAVEEGRLPDLRSVRASARLAWAATETTRLDASDLLEILQEGEFERPLGVPVGVWWAFPD